MTASRFEYLVFASSNLYAISLMALFSFLVSALIVYLAFSIPSKLVSSHKLPPGPRGWPLLGNIVMLSKLPHHALYDLSKKFGPIIFLRLGSVPIVIASSPRMAQDFLQTHDQVFASRPNVFPGQITGYGRTDIVWAPYGEHWRHMRKICTLELFTAKRVKSFEKVREEEISIMLGSVWEESQKQRPVNIQSIVATLTMNILSRSLLSKRLFGAGTPEQRQFKEIVSESGVLDGCINIGDYFPYLRWLDIQGYDKRIMKLHHRFDRFLQKLVDEHRNAVANDLGKVLMSLPEKDDGTGRLSDDIVKSVFADMLIAGTDTSAITLEWAMTELLRNPRVLEKAQVELDIVVGRDRNVVESDMSELKYIQAIAKETFRLHPPAPLLIAHESMEACKVAGYDLPKKTRLFVNVWGMGRDPDCWEKALEFWPERFEGNSIDVHGHDYQYLPFGAGRRKCPGITMGLAMVHISLARLLQSFWWSLPTGVKPEDVDMSELFGITVPKHSPLYAMATPRISPHLLGLSSAIRE